MTLSAHGLQFMKGTVVAWRTLAGSTLACTHASGLAWAVLIGFLISFSSHAASIALVGMLGGKALLIVGGTTPKTLAVGEVHHGVRVISTSGDQAVVEEGGKRLTLRVGDAPVSVGSSAAGPGRGTRIVLIESSGGHFLTAGQINGRTVQFMVDTGASSIAMSIADAERTGVAYKGSEQILINTANGSTLAYIAKLDSVRIGDVEIYGVDAVVVKQSLPFMLLGNSFLNRFQMKRDNNLMTLEKRY